jgi:hypothetical protein
LFHDYNSGIEDDQALYGEIQATEIYTDPTTGKIYSIANDTGAFIHEVSLPKLTPVTGQVVTLTAEQAAQVKPWDPDGPGPGERPRYDVAFTPKAPAIDGNLFTNGDPWFHLPSGVNVREMTVLLDGKRIAGVRALYDRENLYLAYDVRAPHGPINSGSELPFAPFVSGAYVDFDLGTHWSGTRRQTQAGDLRVILAQVRAGSGIKAFQQAFWPVKENGQRPRTIQSPAAQVHFDDIGELPGLKMAYKVDKPDTKEGIVPYSVEVSVPLASLGLNEPAGKTVGFDASVGVANAAGDRRERAAHWGGLSEGVVVDRPGSAALLPETWGSLTFLPASPAADQ